MTFDLCSKANFFLFRGKLIFIKSGGKLENFAHKFFEYAPFQEFDDRNRYDPCIVHCCIFMLSRKFYDKT